MYTMTRTVVPVLRKLRQEDYWTHEFRASPGRNAAMMCPLQKLNKDCMDREVAQLVKVFATKPDDLSCILELTWEKERADSLIVLQQPQTCWGSGLPQLSVSINKCEMKSETAGQSCKIFIVAIVSFELVFSSRVYPLQLTHNLEVLFGQSVVWSTT